MEDSELRDAILDRLQQTRTQGAGGQPLAVTDAHLAEYLRAPLDQMNRVLSSLMDEGLVHGRPTALRTGRETQPEWDLVRVSEDPLPPPDVD